MINLAAAFALCRRGLGLMAIAGALVTDPTAEELDAFTRFQRGERLGRRGRPAGTAADVAEFLAPYAAAGCTAFNLIPQSAHEEQTIAGVAAVKRLLISP